MSDFDTVRARHLDRIEAMMRARTIEKHRELTCDDHRGKDYSEETLLCQWCYREKAEAQLTRLREAARKVGHDDRCLGSAGPISDDECVCWVRELRAALTQENNDAAAQPEA